MEPDVKAFLEEIVAVCRRHGLMLTVSEYDHLQVWPLGGDPDDDASRLDEILNAAVMF